MKAKQCPVLPKTALEGYLTEMMPAQIVGAIYDSSVGFVEDHLLICPTCQEHAETHEFLLPALKADQAVTRGHVRAMGMTLPSY